MLPSRKYGLFHNCNIFPHNHGRNKVNDIAKQLIFSQRQSAALNVQIIKTIFNCMDLTQRVSQIYII